MCILSTDTYQKRKSLISLKMSNQIKIEVMATNKIEVEIREENRNGEIEGMIKAIEEIEEIDKAIEEIEVIEATRTEGAMMKVKEETEIKMVREMMTGREIKTRINHGTEIFTLHIQITTQLNFMDLLHDTFLQALVDQEEMAQEALETIEGTEMTEEVIEIEIEDLMVTTKEDLMIIGMEIKISRSLMLLRMEKNMMMDQITTTGLTTHQDQHQSQQISLLKLTLIE